jgi:hypothetical protein
MTELNLTNDEKINGLLEQDKKLMRRLPLLTLLIILYICIFTYSTLACTTAIISGKATADGRPLLYKHRDTDYFQNKLMFFNDGNYSYIGLVNSNDIEGKEIWAGANSAGFAIMNSASYNLNVNDTTKLKDQEGIIMKEALRSCATLKDFELLLRNWPKPLGVEANFGVIDARGGAAYFETSNFSYKIIDANDSKMAPLGYIIRTNYSISGTPEDGLGYIRYETAKDLFTDAVAQNKLSHRFLLGKVSRSLKHSLLKIDLEDLPLPSVQKIEFINFQDFIPRYTSVSTMVVQGIRENESAEFTTIWTILGFPLSSIAIPTWVCSGPNLPELLLADKTKNAPLCQMALDLKKKCFPITKGSGKKYINLAALLNEEKQGILQKLRPLEESIIQLTERHLADWRRSGFEEEKIQTFYRKLNTKVSTEYKSLFGF